jgi:transcriptional regulator with XRE-family HTH domain
MSNSTNTTIMTERGVEVALARFINSCATGRRVRFMREAAHVSQAELAAYVGTSRRTIHRVEHGTRALTPAERAAIARALGCSIATLAVGASGNGRGAA